MVPGALQGCAGAGRRRVGRSPVAVTFHQGPLRSADQVPCLQGRLRTLLGDRGGQRRAAAGGEDLADLGGPGLRSTACPRVRRRQAVQTRSLVPASVPTSWCYRRRPARPSRERRLYSDPKGRPMQLQPDLATAQRSRDVHLQSRLRRAAGGLASLLAGLLRSDAPGPGQPPAPWRSGATPRRRDAEQAFLAWLADPTSADELPLAGRDGSEPLARILGQLSRSRRVLPAALDRGRLLEPDDEKAC